MKTWHIFRSHDLEIITAHVKRPIVRVRWAPGWAQALPDGWVSQSISLHDWRERAQKENAKLRRHRTEAGARQHLQANEIHNPTPGVPAAPPQPLAVP